MGKSYIDKKSAIYLGDSALLLPRIRPATVKLILTDPPYNVTRENNFDTMGRTGIKYAWDGEFDQLSWLPTAVETLVPGGSMIIWNDWKNLGDIARALIALGLDVKRELVWVKSNPMPRNTDRSYVQSREFALWAVKVDKKHPWTFNKREGKAYERGEFHYPVQHSFHPAKKPDGLFQELVEIHTNPGDLVVDPFAGEGTTTVACFLSNRRCIAFEKDPTFYDAAEKYLAAFKAPQKHQALHKAKKSKEESLPKEG